MTTSGNSFSPSSNSDENYLICVSWRWLFAQFLSSLLYLPAFVLEIEKKSQIKKNYPQIFQSQFSNSTGKFFNSFKSENIFKQFSVFKYFNKLTFSLYLFKRFLLILFIFGDFFNIENSKSRWWKKSFRSSTGLETFSFFFSDTISNVVGKNILN